MPSNDIFNRLLEDNKNKIKNCLFLLIAKYVPLLLAINSFLFDISKCMAFISVALKFILFLCAEFFCYILF